ncbi:hypothetical protein, partial [Pseudomonas fluorescens]|uniref:hypothetical protein n=1 Tax=Pseudomonas fluorescens TaxID=294 RepID=UPI001CD2CFC2
ILLCGCDEGVTGQIQKARYGCASYRTSNAVNSLKCSDFNRKTLGRRGMYDDAKAQAFSAWHELLM